ncbi:MAG: glycosyltransferase family 2 protein [Candidatus Marinimicrobia bacterium]|nr:glycosyltransferase family 2 protein [Candidatus Neomarinimicrobiota bacterium]
MKRRHTISAFVITNNEADQIEDCLSSLSGWVDQLVVLDSNSDDNTAELARIYTEEVYVTDWPGYSSQRIRALKKCSNDWVLTIDADEQLTQELRDEIDTFLSQEEIGYNLFKFPLQTSLFGKFLKYGRYSSPQKRLFLKKDGYYKNKKVHENVNVVDPKIKLLKSPLIHNAWRNYYHLQEKHLKYAVLSAEEKYEQGKTTILSYTVLRLFTDFLQQYIFRLGFLDGWRGFLMAIVLAQYAFNKYASLLSMNKHGY